MLTVTINLSYVKSNIRPFSTSFFLPASLCSLVSPACRSVVGAKPCVGLNDGLKSALLFFPTLTNVLVNSLLDRDGLVLEVHVIRPTLEEVHFSPA
jgi:hypothetical protein